MTFHQSEESRLPRYSSLKRRCRDRIRQRLGSQCVVASDRSTTSILEKIYENPTLNVYSIDRKNTNTFKTGSADLKAFSPYFRR